MINLKTKAENRLCELFLTFWLIIFSYSCFISPRVLAGVGEQRPKPICTCRIVSFCCWLNRLCIAYSLIPLVVLHVFSGSHYSIVIC